MPWEVPDRMKGKESSRSAGGYQSEILAVNSIAASVDPEVASNFAGSR